MAISKFRGKQQILRLGLKFRGLQKTVGPANYRVLVVLSVIWFILNVFTGFATT